MTETEESRGDTPRDAQTLLAAIDRERLPTHVAVIMDGNGRWAQAQGLPRAAGHQAGVESVREILRTAGQLGVKALTLYAFSRENWNRPAGEVDALMRLLRTYLDAELDAIHREGIRFRSIGRRADLPVSVRERVEQWERHTANNDGMLFQLALSYSGRAELVDATRTLARRVAAGELAPEDIDETMLGDALYTGGVPDPDLLIRTSGELRVSNYLLWQIAYAELWVTPVLWPDFRAADLYQAIVDYQARDRRFGKVR